MKVDQGFKQLFRTTLATDAGKPKVESQDGALVPIDSLRTKLGERALYDPSVLRLPAFFGTGGTSSDQLRLRPPDKSSTPPHEMNQAVGRVKSSLERIQDPRFDRFVSVLQTIEGFQRSIRPRMTNYEG